MVIRQLVFAVLAIVWGSFQGATAAEHITVQLKWCHQAQFAGFYVAIEKGYYAAEGLYVTLVPGGEKVDLVNALVRGAADIAVLSPEDIIIRRSQGIPLTAIAAIYRRSAVVYLSRQTSGILRPRDFIGKTIAAAGQEGSVRDFDFQLDAMLSTLGIDLRAIQKVPYDPEYKGFLNGTVDVTAAYATGGLIRIRQNGITPNLVWPGDYRVRFFSDTLATTDRQITDRPAMLHRFIRATLKGWETAIGDPAGTMETVMKYAKVKDRQMQTAMFDAMIPLVYTGEDRIGWMRPTDWLEMHQVLVEQKIIDKPVNPVDRLFTMQFIDVIGQGKQ